MGKQLENQINSPPLHHSDSAFGTGMAHPPGTRFTPSNPLTGTHDTCSGPNPLFAKNGSKVFLMNSKRSSEYPQASILLTATMTCDTPRDRARRTCSRVWPTPTDPPIRLSLPPVPLLETLDASPKPVSNPPGAC